MTLPGLGASRLSIYLNDHLAGATAGVELARRSAASNRSTDFGPRLEELAAEIEQDRETLAEIMRRLSVGVDRLKVLASWGAEKAGRLKLNGQLTGYSPLSRLVELEGLVTGIKGKESLWRSLLEIAPQDSRLDEARIGRLLDRAQEQLRTVEELRLRATRDAFLRE
jgi:predicted DNA-binding ribbon-helix-helix protein